MKKTLLSLIALVAIIGFTGCEKVEVGNYKEGTYNGSVIDTYNNENNTATAEVKVDKNGKIVSVNLDTTYKGSTKKTLKDDYNMKKYNSSAAGEWYEQVARLEQAVVNNQGTEKITLDDDGYTDTVSGCTIKIDALMQALEKALAQAKK